MNINNRININNNTTTIVDVRPGVQVSIPAIPRIRDRVILSRVRIDILRERQRVIDETASVQAALAQQSAVDQSVLLAQLDRLQQIEDALAERLSQVTAIVPVAEPTDVIPTDVIPTDVDPGVDPDQPDAPFAPVDPNSPDVFPEPVPGN